MLNEYVLNSMESPHNISEYGLGEPGTPIHKDILERMFIDWTTGNYALFPADKLRKLKLLFGSGVVIHIMKVLHH